MQSRRSELACDRFFPLPEGEQSNVRWQSNILRSTHPSPKGSLHIIFACLAAAAAVVAGAEAEDEGPEGAGDGETWLGDAPQLQLQARRPRRRAERPSR